MANALLTVFVLLVAVSLLCAAYIISNDAKLARVSAEAQSISPRRWTEDEIRACHARLVDGPKSVLEGKLPPKTGRRYIVVGGVGCYLILACKVLIRHSRPGSSEDG